MICPVVEPILDDRRLPSAQGRHARPATRRFLQKGGHGAEQLKRSCLIRRQLECILEMVVVVRWPMMDIGPARDRARYRAATMAAPEAWGLPVIGGDQPACCRNTRPFTSRPPRMADHSTPSTSAATASVAVRACPGMRWL